MFSIFKEYQQNNNLNDFQIPLSKDAEKKMLSLTKEHYKNLINKYPFQKDFTDEEFYQLSRGVLISLLATCTDESHITNVVDCYHMYIIKMYFIFCVARGFHINISFCKYLDKMCNNFFKSDKIAEYWIEFNNNYDDMPLWDALMKETDFANCLKKQQLKNFTALTMVEDIKKINEDNEHLFEFFMEAINYFNFEDENINPLYIKYIELCQTHYLPLPNFENDSDEEGENKDKYNTVKSE
jgi:hypothetical protein